MSLFKLKPKLFILAFLSLTMSMVTFGQSVRFTGKVVDGNRVGIPDVTVSIRDTETKILTDKNGNFSISAPSGSVAVFSHVNFEPVEIQVGSQDIVGRTIQLNGSEKSLDQVVVVGYGTLNKKDFTGSSAKVKASTLTEIPPTTLENALQGRMAGVNITNTSSEPGGGVNIQIRGITSISGGNQPLYVIDGVPMFNDNSRSSREFEGNVATNFLATINPADILSVEVLKDASATAIYGSRGANGVILVTTKRGRYGKARIDVGVYNMTSMAPKPIDLVNAREYAIFSNEFRTNSNLPPFYTGQWIKSANKQDSIYFPRPDELGEGTNWQKELMQTANSQNYQVSVSGGGEAVRYLVSGNYLSDEGVVKVSKYRRATLRSNFDIRASEKLGIKLDLNLANDFNDRAENSNARGLAGGFERSGVILKAFATSPILENDFSVARQTGFANSGFEANLLNPLSDLINTINKRTTLYTQANMDINYRIVPNLTLTVRGGYNGTDANTDMFWGLNTMLGYSRNQKTFQSNWKTRSYLNENFLSYDLRKTRYNLNLIGGVSYQKTITNTTVLGGENLPFPTENGLYYLPSYINRDIPNTNRLEDALLSAYSRASFSYDNKYLFTVTARTDGSSRFAKDKKWAFFPSFGVGWNFMNESFMSFAANTLSSGKIRASYGFSGNQAISPYQSLPSLGVINYGFINSVVGVVTQRPGNSNLSWETTKQLNIGLDLGFLKERVRFTADVYRKVTEDLLQNLVIPSQSGYSSIVSNFGSIENKGIELTVDADILTSRKFRWNTNLNFSINRNNVLDLGNGIKYYNYSNGSMGGEYTHRLAVGRPFGMLWGFKTAGLLTEKDVAANYPALTGTPTEGFTKVVDVNNDGKINDFDKVELGNVFPKYTIGWNNNFTYGNFSLNVFFVAVQGQKILNQNKVWQEYGASTGIPTQRYYDNYWRPDRKDAFFPKPSIFNPNFQTMDRLVEDGSFIRLKNLGLRYNLAKLPRGFSKIQVYLNAGNLVTFTKYTGYDPEVSAFGQNNLLAGTDLGSYPRTRTFTFGIDLGL